MAESKHKTDSQGATSPQPGDYPLGSPQSRAAARLRSQGISDASKGSAACICFPEDPEEQPFFPTNEDQERAAKVQCPVHGRRFEPRYHIYVAAWRWEREQKCRWPRLSTQYHKAWVASFPQSVQSGTPELHNPSSRIDSLQVKESRLA